MKRVILIVLDSVGIGALPDAKEYGDEGSNTLRSISTLIDNRIPNLKKLGLAHIDGVDYLTREGAPEGCFGRAKECSKGKDTPVGHWELTGVITEKALPTYPDGFPQELLNEFEEKIGCKVISRGPISGTTVIEELGREHMDTGYPIVYTSSDSVFQIAAHEDIISIERLYEMCEIARELLIGEHSVGRVVARPFTTENGKFVRTRNRHDYALKPKSETALSIMKQNGLSVKAVGKINDIFSGVGITHTVSTKSNDDGMDKTIAYLNEDFDGMIFTNLVDFDMLYGHRNDVSGYANALCNFDDRLDELINKMNDTDILIITADHGCDPAFPGTDHTREYIPILIYSKQLNGNINIGTRETFADVGKTILNIFDIKNNLPGNCILM